MTSLATTLPNVIATTDEVHLSRVRAPTYRAIKYTYAYLVALADGWNVHDVGEGWKESSHSLFLPTGGVLEISAEGLTGCEVRFVYDGDMTQAYSLRADVAMTSRPVRGGSHRVAVQWRGPIDCPKRCMTSFHYLTRTLAQLEKDAPAAAAVMKKNNPAGFVLCDALVVSQPAGVSYQVYGIFTVDKKALASAKPNAPVVKQDFLVHDRTTDPEEITYYTGLRAPGPHRSIEASASVSARRITDA